MAPPNSPVQPAKFLLKNFGQPLHHNYLQKRIYELERIVSSLKQRMKHLSSQRSVLLQPVAVGTANLRTAICATKGWDTPLPETNGSSESNDRGFCDGTLNGKASSCRSENDTTLISVPAARCKFKPRRVCILVFILDSCIIINHDTIGGIDRLNFVCLLC